MYDFSSTQLSKAVPNDASAFDGLRAWDFRS
jgi:hypothetical protein